jgi:hypothetical protein
MPTYLQNSKSHKDMTNYLEQSNYSRGETLTRKSGPVSTRYEMFYHPTSHEMVILVSNTNSAGDIVRLHLLTEEEIPDVVQRVAVV